MLIPVIGKKIENVLDTLRTVGGFPVFCAVEHENWNIGKNIPPEVGVEKDISEIDTADVVLALLPTGIISGGLQYEVGYAGSKGKKVILATEVGSELGYFNQGVVNLGLATHIEFDTPEALVTNLQ